MYRITVVFLMLLMQPVLTFAGNPNVVTNKYTVNGVCDKCKKRIEEAAYLKGVKYADWNVDTHVLTVKYDSTKTSADLILQRVAKAGHDSEHFKATDDDYNKLPSCCMYRSGIKKH